MVGFQVSRSLTETPAPSAICCSVSPCCTRYGAAGGGIGGTSTTEATEVTANGGCWTDGDDEPFRSTPMTISTPTTAATAPTTWPNPDFDCFRRFRDRAWGPRESLRVGGREGDTLVARTSVIIA